MLFIKEDGGSRKTGSCNFLLNHLLMAYRALFHFKCGHTCGHWKNTGRKEWSLVTFWKSAFCSPLYYYLRAAISMSPLIGLTSFVKLRSR